MIKKLEKFEYISFDIFDTLIKRNVLKPTDIFDIMEYSMMCCDNNLKNFKSLRISSEKKLYLKNDWNEISLNQIYDEMNIKNQKQKDFLIELEKQTEINICQFNNQISEVYNWAKNNKKIIITSDMYLPEETIKQILEKCGIDKYEKLYLSSTYGKTKRKGDIFGEIINDLKIESNKIIHIGDNKKSDYYNPQKYGIKSILFKNEWKSKYYDVNDYTVEYKSMRAFINNNIPEENYYYKMGYECLGPILYGFNKWLIKEMNKNNISKVFFFSRDGKPIKDAFDIINNQKNLNSKYFYASRRSLIVPSLWKYDTLEDMLKVMFVGKRISINSLLKKLGLNRQLKEIENADVEQSIDDIFKNEKFLNLFDDLKKEIQKNSKEEYENLMKYVKKMDFNGKIAIVDIGWFGNMQNSLTLNLKNLDIYGYYVGLNPYNEYQDKYHMKGFLFDKYNNIEAYNKEHYFNSIFEFVFLAQHGSVKRFINDEQEVEFLEYEYKGQAEEKIVRNIQDGAIKFVTDFSTYERKIGIDIINEKNAFTNFLKFGIDPDLEDAINFGDIKFMDNKVSFIAKPKKEKYKVLDIKNIIKEYKSSLWRIGFMKRIIKKKLPYYKINKIIRSICVKGENN